MPPAIWRNSPRACWPSPRAVPIRRTSNSAHRNGAILVGLRDLDLALKERLDVPSRGVKSFAFTLHDLARICLALSVGMLDAQGRDIVKVLSVAGKVTDRLDHAVGELANASRTRRLRSPKSEPKGSTGR